MEKQADEEKAANVLIDDTAQLDIQRVGIISLIWLKFDFLKVTMVVLNHNKTVLTEHVYRVGQLELIWNNHMSANNTFNLWLLENADDRNQTQNRLVRKQET